MLFLKKTALILIVIVFFFACRKPTGANWDVDVVLPLVHSVLNVKNFLGDTIFKTGENGLLILSINRQVAELKLDSLLRLPDTTVITKFVSSSFFPIDLQPGQSFTFEPSDIKFDISNGIQLKKVDIRTGALNVKFSNTVKQPLDIVYEMPGVTKNGKSFVITETVPPGTNSLIKTFDMAGYSFNMQGLSGLVYNTIAQHYTVSLNPNSFSVSVEPGQGAIAEISYTKIIPEYIEGYFGQQTIDMPADTARFAILSNFRASNFMLSQATMDFKILNEFGAEFTANLSNIKSINTTDNKVVGLNNSKLSNININSATRAGATIYPSVKLLDFNPSNSNITAFISNFPDKLAYQGKININPLGNISGYNNFAFYNTGIRINADINIPMRFTADYFELRSNPVVDFSSLEQLDNVNRGSFVVKVTNGYPFSATVQAYMIDNRGGVIDSLFVPGFNNIAGAFINGANEVTAANHSAVRVPITPAKIENLKKCKSIRILSHFIMPPNPPEIIIRETYEFEVNIIAEVNYNVGVRSR